MDGILERAFQASQKFWQETPFSCVCTAINGVLLGAALIVPTAWPFALISFFLLLSSIQNASAKEAFLHGYIFGLGVLGTALSWLFAALPLNWLGVDSPWLGFGIVLLVWLFYILILAVVPACWTCLARALMGSRWFYVMPLLWVAGEFLRALLFSLISYGGGSIIGIDFSFGFIGYALAWSPGFLWLAKLGGAAVLSFTVVALGFCLWSLANSKKTRGVRWRIIAIAVLGLLAYGSLWPSPVSFVENPETVTVEGLRIAPVTTYLEPVLRMTREDVLRGEEELVEKIQRALEADPDIIVLPEYARYLLHEHRLPEEKRESIRQGLKTGAVLLVDSERALPSEGGYGRILFLSGETGVIDEHRKRLLMPLGEYLPGVFVRLFSVLGLEEQLADIARYKNNKPWDAPFETRLYEWRGVALGVLACSEIFSPFSYQEVSAAGADVLINIASHSWMRGESRIVYFETLAMARVHATLTGKPFLQVSNYDPAFVLYPR